MIFFIRLRSFLSTCATDDDDSELKNLLVIVNDMANTNLAQKEAAVYQKKKKPSAK